MLAVTLDDLTGHLNDMLIMLHTNTQSVFFVKGADVASPSMVYDSDDDYGGAPEDDNRDSHHLRMTDVPVAGDDHQDVPVTENDCQDALVTDDGHQDVLVADNDHQDVPVTGNSHQEQSPPVAFPMVDSDARRYPRRSHRPPQ